MLPKGAWEGTGVVRQREMTTAVEESEVVKAGAAIAGAAGAEGVGEGGGGREGGRGEIAA